jgi:hypothetical protein
MPPVSLLLVALSKSLQKSDRVGSICLSTLFHLTPDSFEALRDEELAAVPVPAPEPSPECSSSPNPVGT